MNKDNFIKSILPKTICMTPDGFPANELKPKEFNKIHHIFFEKIFEISKADISQITGYGKFNDDCKTDYTTCREYLVDTFTEEREGYWYHWKEMFETTMLKQDVFDKFYNKMEERIEYCEGKRFLVNNFTYFSNIVTDGKATVGFPDWSKAGISDFLTDYSIMDLHRPYLKIPELLVEYCRENRIEIPNFKDRYLCMAYYNAINGLRWHASIDDAESCESIARYLNELEDRIMIL